MMSFLFCSRSEDTVGLLIQNHEQQRKSLKLALDDPQSKTKPKPKAKPKGQPKRKGVDVDVLKIQTRTGIEWCHIFCLLSQICHMCYMFYAPPLCQPFSIVLTTSSSKSHKVLRVLQPCEDKGDRKFGDSAFSSQRCYGHGFGQGCQPPPGRNRTACQGKS